VILPNSAVHTDVVPFSMVGGVPAEFKGRVQIDDDKVIISKDQIKASK
jgi:hypothetical protein